MQTSTDITLLRRWRDQRDARAFQALTQRYAGLVFGICNRVLKNPADAEEVTQDCFLKLAQHPLPPDRAIGPWLHTVAVRGAVDRIRAETCRREREANFESARSKTSTHTTADLLGHVDEAISLLPEELRHCVVGHFLEQRPQGDVAVELGVSTRTVRRRTEEAIRRVRETLEQRGITSSVGALTAMLAGLTADALPPSLSISLGKIAMGSSVRTGSWSMAGKATHIGVIVIMKKGIAAGVVFVLGLMAWWLLGNSTPDEVNFSAEANTEVEIATPSGAVAAVVAPETDDGDGASVIAPGDTPEPEAPVLVAAAPTPLFDRSPYSPEEIKDPSKYAAVTGVVTDEAGRAIAEARITMVSTGFPIPNTAFEDEVTRRSMQSHIEATYSSDEHQYAAVTDSQGEYLIEGIRYLGGGNMGIDAEGFRHRSVPVELQAGDTVTVNAMLEVGMPIHGKIITKSEQPVSDATVVNVAIFTSMSTSGAYRLPRALQTRTDSAGEFTLWLPQAEEAVANLRAISDSLGEDLFEMVPAGKEERITLIFEAQAGTLAGTIYEREGQGAAGHHLYLEGTIVSVFTDSDGRHGGTGSGDGAFLHTTTDENGRYRLENIPVKAVYKASIHDTKGVHVAVATLERLSAGEITTWDYTIEDPILISGTVRGAKSQVGIPDIVIDYAKVDSGENSRPLKDRTRTDQDGGYEFRLVAGPGSYTFDVQLNPNGSIGGASNLAQTLELAPGDKETLDFEVPEPWSQQFQVINQFGRPLEGVRPDKRETINRSTLITVADSVTDTEGMIMLENLAPGSTVSFNFNEPGYIGFETPRIEGEPGEAYPVETLVLYQMTSAVAQLVDAAGAAVNDAIVDCTVHFGDGRTETIKGATDANGWLLLEENVPAAIATLDILVTRDGDDTITGTARNVDLAVDSMNELGVINLGTPGVTTAP